MRKFLLILAAVFGAAISMNAQTGSMVREGVVWNYVIDRISYEQQWAVGEENGYHFRGTKEADGQTYSIYLNGEDEEVALMQQKDGKVYMYLDGYLKDDIISQKNEIEDYDKTYGSFYNEILLYDLDAEVGESYPMPVFDFDCVVVIHLFTVEKVDHISINGESLKFQHLRDGYTVVEGVGPSQGMLHRPQFGWLNTGFSNTYAYLNTLCSTE